MKISKRLRVIGDLVSDNSFILDVGCDHALLDVYVVLNKKNVRAIASDINEGPVSGALKNIKKYGVSDRVRVVLGGGLCAYNDKVDTIVISGMGSRTIVDIIKERDDLFDTKLIISSNNEYFYLRKSITSLGYYIEDEKIVCERGKFYPIIVFKRGSMSYTDFELEFGPVLLKSNDLVMRDYLNFSIDKLNKICDSLGIKYIFRKVLIKIKVMRLKKILGDFYGEGKK